MADRNEIVEIKIVTWETELNGKSYLHRQRKLDSLYPRLEGLTYRNTNPGARTLRKIQVVLYV